MANRLMVIYNLDGKEKHNIPLKIAFRQTILIKIIIGKFIKPRNSFLQLFYSFFSSFFFAFLNHDVSHVG